jgi:hypothetical protein
LGDPPEPVTNAKPQSSTVRVASRKQAKKGPNALGAPQPAVSFWHAVN